MLVYGISNRLEDDHFLFFYEFDNVPYEEVYKEAIRLCKQFYINIAILESSKNSYHMVSFDVLTKKEVMNICDYVTIETDFIHIREQKLWGNPYEDNCLRLGRKFKKKNPKFLKWIVCRQNDHYQAYNHMKTYNAFCGVTMLKIPEFLNVYFRVYFVIYNTGTPRKKWLGGLRKKEYSTL